jgi:imidazole glycerol phosphate synthase subunit HisF
MYNALMGNEYRVSAIEQMKGAANRYVEWYEVYTDKGRTSTEVDDIRFATAFSCSAFGGIRYASKSRVAYDSMVNTIQSHTNTEAKKRD